MQGLFVTEASQAVGFGHLMECLAIADKVQHISNLHFLMIDSEPEAWTHVRNSGYGIIQDQNCQKAATYDFILLNTRKNEFALQQNLFRKTYCLAVLDELGGIKLKCHKLINFSINEDWHQYKWSGAQPEFYLGPLYYPLRKAFRRQTSQNLDLKKVMVTLGGVDRSRSILRVAEFMAKQKNIAVQYILGPGCKQRVDELNGIIAENPKQEVLIAPQEFEKLMAQCECVVCSGGNTIYEAAFLKKKIAVVWEDEHERIQGQCFEKYGLVKIVGGPGFIDETRFRSLLSGEKQFSTTLDIDGKGVERIARIITAH